MRAALALIMLLTALPAVAQQTPARPSAPQRQAQAQAPAAMTFLPCTAIHPDGQGVPRGSNFVALSAGRVAVMVTRGQDGRSLATDFVPIETRQGGSIFMDQRPESVRFAAFFVVVMATVNADGSILIEHWRSEAGAPPSFGTYILLCAP